MYHTLSPFGQQEVQDSEPGDSNGQSGETPGIEPGPQKREEILPRIASLFPLMQDSGSEIEGRVSEMDKVGPPTFYASSRPKADLS